MIFIIVRVVVAVDRPASLHLPLSNVDCRHRSSSSSISSSIAPSFGTTTTIALSSSLLLPSLLLLLLLLLLSSSALPLSIFHPVMLVLIVVFVPPPPPSHLPSICHSFSSSVSSSFSPRCRTQLRLGFILCGSVVYRALTFFYEKTLL